MQPDYELRFHPLDLSRFGKNPYGKPLYRIVWADTRRSKVQFNGKIHTVPRYLHGDEASAAGKWVLEKWAPAEVIMGGLTRDQYDAMRSALPGMAYEKYPERGDYELSYVFHGGEVDEATTMLMLERHTHRMTHTTKAERLQQLVDAEDAKEAQRDAAFDMMFDVAREESLIQ